MSTPRFAASPPYCLIYPSSARSAMQGYQEHWMGTGRLGDGGVRRGQSGKCRIVRQYHVHDCTMTGGRCADTLPHLTALIPPRLRPLADPTSPVAPQGGNGPIVIMASATRPMRKMPRRQAVPCARGARAYWSRRKSDDGSAQPQARAKERGANCRCSRSSAARSKGEPCAG